MATRRSKSYFWSSSLPRGIAYNRFMQKNRPDEITFGRLFDSVPFINDSDDTAKTTEAGHIKVASDTDVKARKTFTAFADGHRRAVQPEQLPTGVAGSTSVIFDSVNNIYKLNGDVVAPGNLYYYGTNGAGAKGYYTLAGSVSVKNSIEYETSSLQLKNDEAAPGNNHVYGTGDTGTKGWFDPYSERVKRVTGSFVIGDFVHAGTDTLNAASGTWAAILQIDGTCIFNFKATIDYAGGGSSVLKVNIPTLVFNSFSSNTVELEVGETLTVPIIFKTAAETFESREAIITDTVPTKIQLLDGSVMIVTAFDIIGQITFRAVRP